MQPKRFSVEQIVAVLKQAELGMSVTEVIRQVAISEQRFCRWKKRHAGLESDQVRELKQMVEQIRLSLELRKQVGAIDKRQRCLTAGAHR